MAGKKITQLPLATSVEATDVIIGQAQGRTSKIPIELLQGLTGVKGDTGAQGSQGVPGEQGPPGETGYDGATGPTGPTGTSGTINVEQRYFDYIDNVSLHGRSHLTNEVSDLGDDDNEYLIELPFTIQFLGQSYNDVWLNSNSYLTFASVEDNSPEEYSIYWPISPATLAVPSITVGASDTSINRYHYGSTNDGRFVIRYEGAIQNGIHDLNAPSTRIWEAWFYESEPGKISIVVDGNMHPGGVWGLHDGVKWIDVYETLPRENQETGEVTNSVDIYTKPPQTAGTIKFSGAGVETYFDGNEAFVTINPLQGLINLDMNGGVDTIITSAGYGLILKSNHGDDITIDSENDVNINAKTPDRENPGDGRDVNINAGGGYGTSGSNYNGGDVNLTAGNSFGSSGASGNVNINSGNKSWRFDKDGNLTLPNGGNITTSTELNIKTDRNPLLGRVNVQDVDELVPPGGVWRLFILENEYPTLGTDINIGETVTTAWGTPITATITDIQQDSGDWQIHVDQDITAGFYSGSKKVAFNSSSKTWKFDAEGVLNFPNNNGQIGQLESPYTGLEFRTGSGADWIGISYGEINDNNTSYFYFDKDGSDYTTANHRAHLQLKNATRDGHLEWLFDSNGNLTLPTGGDIKDSGGNSVLGATGGTNLPSDATGYLYNNGSGDLSWNNIYMNFDGGASSTVFSPSDMSLDGLNANLGLASISITSISSYGTSAQVYANLADNGGYNLTDIGVVWSSAHNPTTADNKIQANPTGASFSVTTGYIPEGTVYIRAYATNSNGTSYSEEQEFTSYICLIKGTLITLADGSTKKIEDIEYSDSLLVWNFDEGKFDSANPVFIAMPSPVMKEHNILKFSDGTELRTILKDIGHRIFNIEAGKFTHPMTDETPIGTTTFKDDESKVTLVSQEIVREDGIFYNILTEGHINVFANGILTSARLNNIYPTEEMKFVKEQINNRSREEFDWVSDDIFKGLRLSEQPKEFDSIQYNLKAKINLMKPKN
jgi:hypothetical protein